MRNEDLSFRPKPADHLIVQCVDDELLIYDTEKNKAHCLNSGMRAVWEHCDGKNSLIDILKSLQRKDGKHFTIDYVRLAIKRLLNEQLLEVNVASSLLPAISRRNVIRKIGAGALIALPVIVSVAIPTPAEAASCFDIGHLCTSNTQCCSGHCGLAGIKLACLP